MRPTHKQAIRLAIALAAAGFVYNLPIAWLTILILAGGGHGWVAGIYSALSGAVLCPAFGIAFAVRRTRFGLILLLLVAVGGAVADAYICHFTVCVEGLSRLDRVFDSPTGLGIFVVWLLLWFLWQFIAVGLLVEKWILRT
jgi:hypothetical protein